MNLQKKAFTLVELIVVITILAILGTIAFISLNGYSKTARDSTRLSDLSTMKTALELFHLDAGKYPEVTGGYSVTYTGVTVWNQGTFGDSTTNNVDRLDKIPLDPLTETEYTYSLTKTKQEYQLGGILEGDDVALNNSLLEQTNAGNQEAIALIRGNYNGVLFKMNKGTKCEILAAPSIMSSLENETILLNIIASGGLVYDGYNNLPGNYRNSKFNADGGFAFTNTANLVAYSDTNNCNDLYSSEVAGTTARQTLIEGLQTAYTGTIIANEDTISNYTTVDTTDEDAVAILGSSIVNNSLGGEVVASSSGGGEVATTGFTLTSTECNDTGWFWVTAEEDNQGEGFCISSRIEETSWQDVGTDYGWSDIFYATTEGGASNARGVTAYFSDYTCVSIGGAIADYDTIDGNGDTIVNRMKWIESFSDGNNHDTELKSIDWINITTNNPLIGIPSMYIADCIDGIKDLTSDMVLGEETITWGNYTDTQNIDATRINRNKYLLAWTNKKGSHLPSAFSNTGSLVGDLLTGINRGEYQVACELGRLTDGNDNNDNKRIWLSALGDPGGPTNWGWLTRVVGVAACGDQGSQYAGAPGSGSYSTRFVIRP